MESKRIFNPTREQKDMQETIKSISTHQHVLHCDFCEFDRLGLGESFAGDDLFEERLKFLLENAISSRLRRFP